MDAGDAMMIEDLIVRLTNLPPNGFSAGRNGDYIWLNSGTGLSVCAIPVTGSLPFGHPRGLLSLHRLESAPRTQIAIVKRQLSKLRLTFATHITQSASRDI